MNKQETKDAITKAQEASEAVRVVATPTGVKFEPTEVLKPSGVAYVETAKAKTKRDLEMEAGAARVARAAEEQARRPPRIISEAERRAEGTNVPLLRPGIALDRMQTGLGPLIMRKLGEKPPEITSA